MAWQLKAVSMETLTLRMELRYSTIKNLLIKAWVHTVLPRTCRFPFTWRPTSSGVPTTSTSSTSTPTRLAGSRQLMERESRKLKRGWRLYLWDLLLMLTTHTRTWNARPLSGPNPRQSLSTSQSTDKISPDLKLTLSMNHLTCTELCQCQARMMEARRLNYTDLASLPLKMMSTLSGASSLLLNKLKTK